MGNFIGTGDTMTTDTISTSTSVFVAYKELAPGNIGATNNTFGGGGYYNFFTEGLLFDVYSDMTIDSVTIYPDDTGTIGIIIQSLLGSTIFNGTFTISAPARNKCPALGVLGGWMGLPTNMPRPILKSINPT